jgi:hypothetical protein
MEEGDDDDDNSFFSLVFGGGGGQRQKTDRSGDEQGRIEEDEGKEEVESVASKLVEVAGEEKRRELDVDKGGSSDDGANDVDDSTQFIEKVIQQRLKKRDSSNGTTDTVASTSNSSSSSTSLPPLPEPCARTTTTTTATSSSSGNSSAQSSRNPRHVVDPRLQVRYDNRGGPSFKAQADSLIMIRGRGGVIVRAEHVVAGAVNVPAADFYGRVEQRRGRLIFDQMHSHAAVDLVSAIVEPPESSPAVETNHARVPTEGGTNNGRRRPSKRSRQQQSSQGTYSGSSGDDHHHRHHHSHHDAHKTPKKVIVGNVSIGAAQRRFWLMIVSLALFLNFLLVMGATAMGLFLSGNLPGQRPKPDPDVIVPAPTPTVVVVVTTAGPVATPHPAPVTNAPTFSTDFAAGTTTAALGNMTMAPSSSPPPSSLFPNITMTDDGNMPSFGPETTRNETSSSGGGPTHVPTMAPVDASKTSVPTMPTDDTAGNLTPTWIALLAGGSVILEAAIVALLLFLHRRWKESNKVLPAPFDDDPEATRACSEPTIVPTTTTTEEAAVNAPRDSDDDSDDENDGEDEGEDDDSVEDSYTFL